MFHSFFDFTKLLVALLNFLTALQRYILQYNIMKQGGLESSYNKAISSFIYRLNLDEFAREYRDYFGWHGFNTREASHVEEMVKRHGSNFIVKNVN